MSKDEKKKTSPLERAQNQVATTERVIKRKKDKLAKAKGEVKSIETEIADLEARLAYEKDHPLLKAQADGGTEEPDVEAQVARVDNLADERAAQGDEG